MDFRGVVKSGAKRLSRASEFATMESATVWVWSAKSIGVPKVPNAGTSFGLNDSVASTEGVTRVISKGGLGDMSARTFCAVAGGGNTTSINVSVGSKRRRVFDDAMRSAIMVTWKANTARNTPYRDGLQALRS